MHLLESDKFKLGLFVTISFFSICIVFIAFGFFDFVSEKVAMVTLFQESVQGLEAGSLVKYRGVPIGKVTDITINTKNTLIRVDMEINLKKLREADKKEKAITDAKLADNILKYQAGLQTYREYVAEQQLIQEEGLKARMNVWDKESAEYAKYQKQLAALQLSGDN